MAFRLFAHALFASALAALCTSTRAADQMHPEPATKFLSAAVTIYPGDEIVPAMLAECRAPLPRSRPGDFAVEPIDVVGKFARRTLLRGQPIPLNAVRSKDLVFSGRSYPLVFRSANMTISAIGVALQRGGAGDVIDVRNSDSGLVIKGRVASGGLLVVEGP